ncbi:hypothetical protein [Rhizobium sp. ICMP 5592]|uniref:hypothetical protein n=1 Tax=Rhizobium sp. ICMP 5592 TaxID=2292445 RepID=UPI001AEE74B9|nr:hypothetical protein [Rhizobium sp. ICMP 5592]
MPLQDAYVANLSNRLAPLSPANLLGTDEMGRDSFSRFIAGSKYTILTGLMTTLLAGASGYLMERAAGAGPTWIGRLVTVLGYVCFVAPSFLLTPRRPNRLLTTALCVFSVLPLFIIALIVVVLGKLTGWTTALALGPLWGVGIAYVIHRARRQDKPVSQAGRDNTARHFAALMASIFAWAVYSHAMLDILGLGAQPPTPSWGSMLVAQGVSFWPQAMAILGFLIVGTAAFSFSDIVSRGGDENHILDKREEISGG